MLEEKIKMLTLGLKFKPFSPFIDILNKKIGELAAGGLINYWSDSMLNPKGIKQSIEEIGPQVLTMDHLAIGFLFCAIPFILCFVALVSEIVIHKFAAKKLKQSAVKDFKKKSLSNLKLLRTKV